MMPIYFTVQEKELIIPFIRQRTALNSFRKYARKTANLLTKLEAREAAHYTPIEKHICISCINQHIRELYSQISLDIPSEICITLPEEAQRPYAAVDSAHSILEKAGYKESYTNKKYKSPPKYLERHPSVPILQAKIKGSETTYLSTDGYTKRYRQIVFMYQEKEYLSFDLTYSISLAGLKFFRESFSESQHFYKKQFFHGV